MPPTSCSRPFWRLRPALNSSAATARPNLRPGYGVFSNATYRASRDHLFTQKRAALRETSLDDSRPSIPALRERLAADQSSPSVRAMRLEQVTLFLEAIERLPSDQRAAVRLRHIEGWSLERIAQQLHRSNAAAAGLLKRGLRGLREQLRERGEEES